LPPAPAVGKPLLISDRAPDQSSDSAGAEHKR
jgi:hypothetical protein